MVWRAQLSFSFGGFFRQNMTTMRMTAFNTAVAGTLKAFRSTAIGFNFWHLFSFQIVLKKSLKKVRLGKMRGLNKTKVALPVRPKTIIFSFSAQEP